MNHINKPVNTKAVSITKKSRRSLKAWPQGPARAPTGRGGGTSKPANTQGQKTALFVYLLVGVHDSLAEAKADFNRLPLVSGTPAWFERNVNGLGKCKTWLAVSRPYATAQAAIVACRKLATFTTPAAVCVRRADL